MFLKLKCISVDVVSEKVFSLIYIHYSQLQAASVPLWVDGVSDFFLIMCFLVESYELVISLDANDEAKRCKPSGDGDLFLPNETFVLFIRTGWMWVRKERQNHVGSLGKMSSPQGAPSPKTGYWPPSYRVRASNKLPGEQHLFNVGLLSSVVGRGLDSLPFVLVIH